MKSIVISSFTVRPQSKLGGAPNSVSARQKPLTGSRRNGIRRSVAAVTHALLFTLGLVLTFAPLASKAQTATPPGQFSYQGFLTDANGLPLATNNPVNYTVVFRIYNGASAGATLLWAEQQVVTVDRGYFTVMLGNGTAVNGVNNSSDLTGLFAGTNTVPTDASDRYLEMTVTDLGNTAIAPRLRLLPSPYAYLATTALNALNVSAAGHVPDTSLSTNVALRAGGNTFSGNQIITGGNIYMDNSNVIRAKNTSGIYDYFLFPRWGDNATYLNYGDGGFYIRNNANAVTMFMGTNGSLGIGTTTPTAPLDLRATAAKVGTGASIDPSVFLRVYNTSTDGSTGNSDVAGIAFGQNSTRQAIVGGTYGNDYLEFYTGGALTVPKMHIDYLGNVGIGTVTPGFPLSFPSTTGEKISLWGNPGNHFGLAIAPSTLQIFTDLATSDIVFGHGQNTNLTETMRIKGNGWVGIGTATPGVPLDVNGSTSLSSGGSYGYLNSTTGAGTIGPGVLPISIRASARVEATEFDAVSDRRIKDVIGQSDARADLQVIQKLRVTDYRMKDRVAHGDTPCKGFIAQEVEKLIPESVTKSRQFVPDIYAAPSAAKFDPAAKTVAVKLAKAHGLKTGDRVRLMTEAGQMDLTVSSVPSEHEFVAANCEKEPKQIFVLGKEVNDFRTLNYDRIFTTGISAMQELARRVTALEAHEDQRVVLEKRAARVDELEREVADLRAVVARLADSKEHQASSRGVSGQQESSEQSAAPGVADGLVRVQAGGVAQQPSIVQQAE